MGVQGVASAQATNYVLNVGAHVTQAKFTATDNGHGQIRAGEECETPSGQTDFFEYGNIVTTINVWSTTPSCQIVIYGFADLG